MDEEMVEEGRGDDVRTTMVRYQACKAWVVGKRSKTSFLSSRGAARSPVLSNRHRYSLLNVLTWSRY